MTSWVANTVCFIPRNSSASNFSSKIKVEMRLPYILYWNCYPWTLKDDISTWEWSHLGPVLTGVNGHRVTPVQCQCQCRDYLCKASYTACNKLRQKCLGVIQVCTCCDSNRQCTISKLWCKQNTNTPFYNNHQILLCVKYLLDFEENIEIYWQKWPEVHTLRWMGPEFCQKYNLLLVDCPFKSPTVLLKA